MANEHGHQAMAEPLLEENGPALHSLNDCERDLEAGVPYATFLIPADCSETSGGFEPVTRVNPRIVSDAILGLSDGLTVPFALSAGLSALGDTKVVVLGSLAELVAGAISMGLGGYVGAKSEVESYEAIRRETLNLIESSATETMAMVRKALAPYSPREETVWEVNAYLHSSPERLLEFLMTFHRQDTEPNFNQAYISAITLALGYFVGGFIPLIPYFIVSEVWLARYESIGVMAITLFVFGYVKTCIVRGWRGLANRSAGLRGGVQMCLVGGMAAGAAVAVVQVIGGTAH